MIVSLDRPPHARIVAQYYHARLAGSVYTALVINAAAHGADSAWGSSIEIKDAALVERMGQLHFD